MTEMKIESDYKGVLATITKPKEMSYHLHSINRHAVTPEHYKYYVNFVK